MKKLGRILANNAILLNCDIQQSFASKIYGYESVHGAAFMMAAACQFLKIPCLVTEQNSKAFGHTVTDILEKLPDNLHRTYDKSTFSMINDETREYLDLNHDRKSAVLYGFEAHLCVQQTCLDLLELGYEVHVLVDGISSISQIDRKAGLKRMIQAGAYPTTAQSVILEIIRDYKLPEFKQMLPYIKVPRNDFLHDF